MNAKDWEKSKGVNEMVEDVIKQLEIVTEEDKPIPHYYGDMIRVLFLIAGIIMLLGLPFFKDLLPIPYIIPILTILVVDFFAGLTNPKLNWVIALNLIISLFGFLVFEYTAVSNFSDSHKSFAFVNQILAIIFFIALYYSTKTLRGFLLKKDI